MSLESESRPLPPEPPPPLERVQVPAEPKSGDDPREEGTVQQEIAPEPPEEQTLRSEAQVLPLRPQDLLLTHHQDPQGTERKERLRQVDQVLVEPPSPRQKSPGTVSEE